ncbi:MAG: HEAT repeat domain-containing protein [Planctomycetota bacterium]
MMKRTCLILACAVVMGGLTAWAAAEPTGSDSRAVGELEPLVLNKDPDTAPVLRAALDHPDPIARRLAIYGLQRIGDVTNAAAIRPLLDDPDPWVRRTAAVALGKLRDATSAEALLDVLDDDDLHLRYEAFLALGRIGEPPTQAAILKAMADRRLWTELAGWDQAALVGVLARPWFTDPAAKDLLVRLLEYGDWEHPELADLEANHREAALLRIPHRAAEVLAVKFDDASGLEYLIAGLGGDPYMQQRSARAVAALGSGEAVEGLTAMLESRWLLNRRYALEALGAIGTPAALEAVKTHLDHEDIRVRRAAATAYRKITGEAPAADLAEPPPAEVPEIDAAAPATPGGKRPPQFIVLGVDDCVNIEGLEAMLDIVETLRAHGRKAVFTMWVAPLASDYANRDLLKQTLILQRLFDLGCEIAHHTLHHNPGGHNWASLPRERQIEEIEGCTQWYRDNIDGFTRPFSHKGGGGGYGAAIDRAFTRQLLAGQNFIYRGSRGGHPDEQTWPEPTDGMMRIPTGSLDAAAPPVHAVITDGITSDYPGRFDYEVGEGVNMFLANLDYRYRHPRRPILAVNAFHDWGFKTSDDSVWNWSHRNQAAILKQFLLEVLVRRKDEYPDAHCVTLRQVVEYVNTGGDLERALAIGNGQDRRNPVVAAESAESAE